MLKFNMHREVYVLVTHHIRKTVMVKPYTFCIERVGLLKFVKRDFIGRSFFVLTAVKTRTCHPIFPLVDTCCAFQKPVQPNFRRYYFYFLPDQAKILLDHFNVLDELWGESSTGFDNRWRISPYTPIVKIAYFWNRRIYRYGVAKCERFFQQGSMGICFIFRQIQLKFSYLLR